MDQNKAVYDNEDVVKSYKEKFYLDKPELSFFCKFKNKLKSAKMLDIGVGGGRTTYYFAHQVGEYVGVDYSENMVNLCQNKFPNVKVLKCDVRDMRIFGDNYFDLVLFSFNGIDYISHDDRLKALNEIKRVCKKPGGIFFFSSHNFDYIRDLFQFKYTANPIIMLINVYVFIQLRLKNQDIEYDKGCAIIKDGAHNFKLSSYYISPEKQIAQLNDAGFKNIRIYSLNSGMELENEIKNIDDPWLYYLCET